MMMHTTHDMGPRGCFSCGLAPGAADLIAPCANSRCVRCRDLAGCCRCQEVGPRIGEDFVFMPQADGAWDEWTETIADVLGRIEDGSWRVEVGHARVERVPPCFLVRDPDFGAPRMVTHHVVFFDGRWWQAEAAEDEKARRLTAQEAA